MIHAVRPVAPQPPTSARYRANLSRHLIGIARDLQLRMMSALRDGAGYPGLRPSFGPFLSLVATGEQPLGWLASELAISRQACGQLADLAEAAGYVGRRRRPGDARSKLLVLTPRGEALVRDALEVLRRTEELYAGQCGARLYRSFTAAVGALARGLELGSLAPPARGAGSHPTVGVLPLVAVRIERRLMQATTARGHAGLKMSHGQVLPLIGPRGGRIAEIARIQQVSRQAIGAIVKELEGLGYLRREPDPRDRRGVVLQLTRRGEALLRDAVAAQAELACDFRGLLGERRFARLERGARTLYHALRLEAEVFPEDTHAEGPMHETGAPTATRSTREIQQLARMLRRRLGRDDTERLAALLQPAARRESA